MRLSGKHPLTLVAVLVWLLAIGAHRIAAETAKQPPNILFIAIDDLNDWVGFLSGHPQTRTPNMDRLTARGVIFANANCAPLCSPSRAAVFSGRHPFRTGVYGNTDDLRRSAPSLPLFPQQLKARGYRTFGAGKLMHEPRPDIFDETFTPEQRCSPFTGGQVRYTPEELPSKGTSNPRHVVNLGPDQRIVLPLNRMPSERRSDNSAGESFDWGAIDVPDSAMGDAKIVDWAIERMRSTIDAPFFLGVGFYRPHIPLFAPAKYFEPFGAGKVLLPPTRADDLDDVGTTGRAIALEADTAGSDASVTAHGQSSAAVAAYLSCVFFVDTQLGRVLDALDSGPHATNTWIVLWGDHGWHLGEKSHWGKWTGWERAVRVPLVVIPPSHEMDQFAVGATCHQPVSLLDLYPTLIEVSLAKPPVTDLDGESLVPLLKVPQRSTGRAVVSTFHGEHFSVRDDRWRYIRYADGSEELYDHVRDPNEWSNVSMLPENAAVKLRLNAAIPRERVPIKNE